jgi:hypothetical protein
VTVYRRVGSSRATLLVPSLYTILVVPDGGTFLVEFSHSFIELVGVVDRVQAAANGSLPRFDGSCGVPVSYLLRSTSVEDDTC